MGGIREIFDVQIRNHTVFVYLRRNLKYFQKFGAYSSYPEEGNRRKNYKPSKFKQDLLIQDNIWRLL